MKKYQVALISFALGIFLITSLGIYFFKKVAEGLPVTREIPAEVEYKTVQTFFSNDIKDPQMMDCEITYPVDRAVSRLSENEKSGLAEYIYLAISELLKGPGDADKVNGYFTSINEGTKVQGIILEGGKAIVDFNEKLSEGVAGSCKVLAIRSQITETLKQFPEIEEVGITINGEGEDILEP